MLRFFRKPATAREPLPVVMIGVRMGERLLQIGVADLRLMTMLAAKPGISGRSALIVRHDRDVIRAQSAAADAGVLLEAHVPAGSFPFDDEAFDVVVANDLDMPLAECRRVLRPGGRYVAMEPGSPVGAARLWRSRPTRDASATIATLEAAGFTAVRLLADKEGYRFIEGLRPKA